MEEKKCSKCGEVKPLVEYGTLKGIPHKMPWCKVCNSKRRKKYYSENTEKEKQAIEIYRSKNPDKVKNFIKEYYIKNSSTILKKNKEYRDKNKEKEKQRNKLYYLKNPDYQKNYQKKRYHTDPDFRFGELVRGHLKGQIKRQEFKELWDDVREVYDFYDIPYHIDHMVPQNWFLSRTPKTLINDLNNLQVIDAEYNLSKQDRWSDPVPSDYLDKIRPYIKKEYLGLLKSL